MIKMDVKGITWVGSVYQKFEAMCLEVEEVIFEDTVKYVENQVQTVGGSVKKLYSEVMQDVLPPSSVDPVKVAAADLSLNPYADFSIRKKPKASNKKYTATSNKPDCEDFHVEVSKESRAVASSVKSKGVIKRKSIRENSLPSEVSKSGENVSNCREAFENNDEDTDRIDMCLYKGSDSSRVETFDSVESFIASKEDMISPSEAKKERQLRDTSSDTSAEINGAGVEGVDLLMGSYISCDPKNSESDVEGSVSFTGDCIVHYIDSDDDIVDPRPETIQEFDKSNCVVVDREHLSVAAPVEDKPRSYKKKIQKAFSPKWLAREQEYKQLAMQHDCLGTGPNKEVADSLSPKVLDEENSPPHRIPESEWELL